MPAFVINERTPCTIARSGTFFGSDSRIAVSHFILFKKDLLNRTNGLLCLACFLLPPKTANALTPVRQVGHGCKETRSTRFDFLPGTGAGAS